jgi:FkbM family methyltransferase
MANAFSYYLCSIFTLMKGVKNFSALIKLVTREPEDNPIELDLGTNGRYCVSTLMDAWILKETILDRQYEKVSVPLEKNWTVIDIGAALGDYAVWAAKQVPDGVVYAVEPFPQSVKIIQKNLELNHVGNVVVCEKAVGGQDGLSGLQLVTGQAVQHSTAALSGAEGSLAVNISSLRTLLNENNIAHCDYLKLDCEGAEFDILFKCPKDVLSRIQRICMEVHDRVTFYSREDMVHFLEENGYKTRLTPNPVHKELAYLYAERTD